MRTPKTRILRSVPPAVKDIYQCSFYRGLLVVPKGDTHPAWEYDYACLLAFDASDEGNLSLGWKQNVTQIRRQESLGKDSPEPRALQPPEMGSVVAVPQVGGLHDRYERRAA